ncbi:MAG TPA: argininosuccinate synthase [Polyangia bacterium]|jgi:argininosuccinate synthase|nr:argininosuccinate synthase [Polyangia bacterium]
MKIVLAYSGGLDTSVAIVWLKEKYNAEIVGFCSDVGQGEDLEATRKKALRTGAISCHVVDQRDEFVGDYVFAALRAAAVYEGEYLLGTALARPCIAKGMMEVAAREGATAIAHGATGKGNDQVRFEMGAYWFNPSIRVIAPWREWEFKSRSELLAFSTAKKIPVEATSSKPYSIDRNLLHTSYEGGVLEDPDAEPPADMFQRTADPTKAPDTARDVAIGFEKGVPVSVDGRALGPAALLSELNTVAGEHGVGRADVVEDRFVGMKSRGVYETPGGTLLHKAHRAVASLTMDREAMRLRDSLSTEYATLVYRGFWFSPEREALQRLVDAVNEPVTGVARLRLYKGGVIVVGRSAPRSLYRSDIVTFEDDRGAYDQRDASGFIRLNALRLRTTASALKSR